MNFMIFIVFPAISNYYAATTTILRYYYYTRTSEHQLSHGLFIICTVNVNMFLLAFNFALSPTLAFNSYPHSIYNFLKHHNKFEPIDCTDLMDHTLGGYLFLLLSES